MAEITNDFSWSVSRARLFNECRRAYYYNYYGSWGGWKSNAPDQVRLLYILKNIQTLEIWAGSIVHDIAREALNRFAQKQTPVSTGELQARGRQMLRSGWVDAVEKEWEKRPKKTNLHGLYYGDGKMLPSERTDKIKARVYDALAAFAESAILKEVLALPYMNWKTVDELDSFRMEEDQDLKIWCAIDLAYTDAAGRFQIVDWKTGKEDAEALRIQLGCYALYAAQKWNVPFENLDLKAVMLNENARVSNYSVTPDTIVKTRDRMLTSAAEMRAVLRNPAVNEAVEEDFPVAESENPCRRCNFHAACPKFT